MTHINNSALLPYSDKKMFALVNDVASYPDFLVGCDAAVVHHADEASMKATLVLKKQGIKMSFTTHNALDYPKSIEMTLVEGPFSAFSGRWFFQYLKADACKVMLDIQFTLNNPLLGVAARNLFDSVSRNLVDSIVQRARSIYG